MKTCAVLIIRMVRLQRPSPLLLPLVQPRGPELKLGVQVWVLTRPYPLHTRLAIITTTKLDALRSGKRCLASIPLQRQHWKGSEATNPGHAKPETLSRMAASAIARTSGVIRHRYLGREKMARRCWEGRRWITRACMKARGLLRGGEGMVTCMRRCLPRKLYEMN